MILRLLTTPLRALRRIFSPCTSGGADTGSGGAAGTTVDEELREWAEKLDAWLTSLKTNPDAREAFAFLQRLLRHNPQDPLDSLEVSATAIYQTFAESAATGDLAFLVARILDTSEPSEIERLLAPEQYLGAAQTLVEHVLASFEDGETPDA